jgi:DNA-binding IclR family transcriptional regulator
VKSRGIQSIEVGGRLLRALARVGEPMMLRDLAREAGMTPAKAHPYLVSFSRLGLVERNDIAGRYEVGALALELGLCQLAPSIGGQGGRTEDRGASERDQAPRLAHSVGHAPVFDHEGAVVLSVTAMGPERSFDARWTSAIAKALLACTNEISRRLGFSASARK